MEEGGFGMSVLKAQHWGQMENQNPKNQDILIHSYSSQKNGIMTIFVSKQRKRPQQLDAPNA